MQGDADARGDGPVDGGGDERVHELEPARGGRCAGEDAGRAQCVGGVGRLLVAESGDGGGEHRMGLGAEDGAGPGEADGRGAEAFEAGDEAAALDGGGEVAQVVRPGLGGGQAAVVDLGGEFYGLEGVPGGDGPALVAERVVGVLAEHLAHEVGDGFDAERLQVERADPRPAGQSPERLGVVREFVGPVRDHDQQRELLGAGCERGQPAQGFGVGPVCVVEDEDHRGAFHREVGEHPVEAVAQTLLVGRGALGGRAQAEGGADDVVPTAQRGTEIGVGRAGELRLQQLAGDVEGDPLFLVAASRGEHGAALGGGAAAHFGEEGGLADAGPPREGEEGTARAVPRLTAVRAQTGQFTQRLVHGGEFTLPLEECPSTARTPLPHAIPPATVVRPRGERTRTVSYRDLSVRFPKVARPGSGRKRTGRFSRVPGDGGGTGEYRWMIYGNCCATWRSSRVNCPSSTR